MSVFFEQRLNEEAQRTFPKQEGKFKIDHVNRLLRRLKLPQMSKLPLASNPYFPFDVNAPSAGGVVVVLGPQEPSKRLTRTSAGISTDNMCPSLDGRVKRTFTAMERQEAPASVFAQPAAAEDSKETQRLHFIMAAMLIKQEQKQRSLTTFRDLQDAVTPSKSYFGRNMGVVVLQDTKKKQITIIQTPTIPVARTNAPDVNN